jgi:hypothetical protein
MYHRRVFRWRKPMSGEDSATSSRPFDWSVKSTSHTLLSQTTHGQDRFISRTSSFDGPIIFVCRRFMRVHISRNSRGIIVPAQEVIFTAQIASPDHFPPNMSTTGIFTTHRSGKSRYTVDFGDNGAHFSVKSQRVDFSAASNVQCY